MYQVMMQQITNDRIKDARQQAKAHRMARQAKTETASAVEKATFRHDPGIASRLLAAAKHVKLRLTFSPDNIR